MSKKKAFVRYANNKLVPASVFIGAKAPAVGVWKEIPYDLCCDAPLCPQPDYSPWRLVTGGEAGDGVVLVDSDPGDQEFTFVGPNDDIDEGWVYLTRYFPTQTCLSINYDWTSFDEGPSPVPSPPEYDRPVYWIQPTEPTGVPLDTDSKVDSTPASGNTQVTIPAGQWFSIGIYSEDSCCGRGFYSVRFSESPGVCPG